MDLTLDYNIELFPLQPNQQVALALATSLSRGPPAEGEEEKDVEVWRPDGKGRRGLEEDYEYVMYGKVYRFDAGNAETVCVCPLNRFYGANSSGQHRIHLIRGTINVTYGIIPTYDEHCTRRSHFLTHAQVIFWSHSSS